LNFNRSQTILRLLISLNRKLKIPFDIPNPIYIITDTYHDNRKTKDLNNLFKIKISYFSEYVKLNIIINYYFNYLADNKYPHYSKQVENIISMSYIIN